MRPTQSQPLVASAVGTIRQPMDRLCYVDPIVILATKRQTVYCGPNSDVYSSTNVRMFIPQSFDNLFGI